MRYKYLIDSSAWIDYFLANPDGEKVKELIEDRASACFTSALSVAEVTIKLKKIDLDYDAASSAIKSISTILSIDETTAFDAALLYVEKRKKMKDIGIVDVILMVQSMDGGLTIVTRDRGHFSQEKNVIII